MAFDIAKMRQTLGNILSNDKPVTVRIGETDYIGNRTNKLIEGDHTDFGFSEKKEFSLVFNMGDFSTLPTPRKTKATIAEKEYRIMEVEPDSADIALTLKFGDVNA